MRCPRCGANASHSQKFCPLCGTRLAGGAREQSDIRYYSQYWVRWWVFPLIVVAILGVLVLICGVPEPGAEPAPTPVSVQPIGGAPSPAGTTPEPGGIPQPGTTAQPSVTHLPGATPVPGATTAPEESAQQDDMASLRYCRSLLSEEEKVLYDRVAEAVNTFQSSVFLGTVGEEALERIWWSVYYDHPECFWMDNGYSFTVSEYDGQMDYELILRFTMDENDAAVSRAEIESIRDDLAAELEGASAYEKVKAVYEYMINNTAYDYDYDDQSLCAAMLSGRAVCAGYTKSMQYLLMSMGFTTLYVQGDVLESGEPHAWNVVNIDGNWYQVDATHGDPLTDDGSQVLSYAYLCLTTDEILRSRTVSDRYTVPSCTSTEHNYYRQAGKYIEAYDTDQLTQMLVRMVEDGDTFDMKFADESLFEETKYNLFEYDELWDVVIPQAEETLGHSLGYTSCVYSENEELYSLSIKLE